MKHREENWNAMARYLAGEMDAKEEIAFRKGIEADPGLKSELNQMEQRWRYFNDHPSRGESETGKAWNKLISRLESDGLLHEGPPVAGRWNTAPVFRAAAVILLILAIGITSVYLGVFRDDTTDSSLRHFAEEGVSTIDLPDGSRVFLNKGAEITLPGGFELERSVALKGEAYFEVMSDPVTPFTVRSGNVVVSVLGTSFNVKETGQAGEIEVYVESGKVRVSREPSGEFITLEPGEIGFAGPDHLNRSQQNDPNYVAWKTKDFKFVDEELTRVLRELEESYHVQIEADAENLAGMRITAAYREQSIEAILETIGTAFGFTVNKKEDHYYLTQ